MKITRKMRQLRKSQYWRRWPTPDCPMCEGSGTIQIKLWSACGQPEFGGQPLTGSCACVLSPGLRLGIAELKEAKVAMIKVTAEHDR